MQSSPTFTSTALSTPTLLKPAEAQDVAMTDNTLLCMNSHDLYVAMRESQGDFVSPETYAPGAAYITFRRYLVDYITQIGEIFKLHDTTIHVSVLFLDKVLRSRDEISRSQWQLLAAACISLAAKYEEAEEHCPYIPQILQVTKLSNVGHTCESFRQCEIRVLNFLNWKLRAIPPLHVIGYLDAATQGLLFQDDRWNSNAKSAKVVASLRKFYTFFSNMTLQQYSYQQYFPTHLAAAILLASRVAVKVEPQWRPELTQLTGYQAADLEPIFCRIWNMYASQFPSHVTKTKYRSISPRTVVVSPKTAITIRL